MAAWSRLRVCHSQVPQPVGDPVKVCQSLWSLVGAACTYDDAGVSNKQARISQHFKWMTETDVNWNALELKSPCNHLLEPYTVTIITFSSICRPVVWIKTPMVIIYASVVGKSKLPTALPLSKYLRISQVCLYNLHQ